MSNQSPSQDPAWTLGERLRKSLRVAGIEGQEMADVLGVSRFTVSNYLADRTVPTRGTLMAWALKTGVNFEWLAGPGKAEGAPGDAPQTRPGPGDSPSTYRTWQTAPSVADSPVAA